MPVYPNKICASCYKPLVFCELVYYCYEGDEHVSTVGHLCCGYGKDGPFNVYVMGSFTVVPYNYLCGPNTDPIWKPIAERMHHSIVWGTKVFNAMMHSESVEYWAEQAKLAKS